MYRVGRWRLCVVPVRMLEPTLPSASVQGQCPSQYFAQSKKPGTNVGLPWPVHSKPAVSSAVLKMLWSLFNSFRGSSRRVTAAPWAGAGWEIGGFLCPLGSLGTGFDVCWPQGEVPLSIRRIAFPKGSINFFKCPLSVNFYPVKQSIFQIMGM